MALTATTENADLSMSHDVLWFARGEDVFVESASSRVLGLSAVDVRSELGW